MTALRLEIETTGLLRSQIAELTLGRLFNKQVAFATGSANFNAVQQEIDANKELIALLQGREAREQAETARQAGLEEFFRNNPTAGANRAVKAYLEEIKAAGLGTERVVGGALRGLEDGMVSLFTKGKFDARSFIDTLIAEFVRLRIVKPLMADIFSSGFFGSLFSGSGGGGLAAIGNMGAAFLIPGMATGGAVQSGAPYIVGERGPELFVPRTAGAIVPNGAGGQRIVISHSTTNYIDARSDRAQVGQAVAQGVAAGNRQLVEMLHARGVL